jgi:hypothetical protein
MVRKTLRVFLWMIKGVLLLIALAALVMWPVSRGQRLRVTADRYLVNSSGLRQRSDWEELLRYTVACLDGRLVLGKYRDRWERITVPSLALQEARMKGRGWKVERQKTRQSWDDSALPLNLGPIRWIHFSLDDDLWRKCSYRYYAAPLWLVALVTGIWPTISISLVVRRRLRRRARREGLCLACGYDLRATPDPGGDLLAVCPECGKASHAGEAPSLPPS